MPLNTVYVGRPTKWGNPFTVGEWGLQTALNKYRACLNEQLFADPGFLEPLKGKDLACWCSLSQPCHADVLLEFLSLLYNGCSNGQEADVTIPKDRRMPDGRVGDY